MRQLTGRELQYIGGKCQWRDKRGVSPCWSPATHRVQCGIYGWWFVCFDHIETTVVMYRIEGQKPRVRTLATPEVAIALGLGRSLYRLSKGSR